MQVGVKAVGLVLPRRRRLLEVSSGKLPDCIGPYRPAAVLHGLQVRALTSSAVAFPTLPPSAFLTMEHLAFKYLGDTDGLGPSFFLILSSWQGRSLTSGTDDSPSRVLVRIERLDA